MHLHSGPLLEEEGYHPLVGSIQVVLQVEEDSLAERKACQLEDSPGDGVAGGGAHYDNRGWKVPVLQHRIQSSHNHCDQLRKITQNPYCFIHALNLSAQCAKNRKVGIAIPIPTFA